MLCNLRPENGNYRQNTIIYVSCAVLNKAQCDKLNVTLQAITRHNCSQQIYWHFSMRLLCILHNRNLLFTKCLQSACSQLDPLSWFYTNFTGKMLPWPFWQVACTASVPPGRFVTFSRAPANRYSYKQILQWWLPTEFVQLFLRLRMQISSWVAGKSNSALAWEYALFYSQQAGCHLFPWAGSRVYHHGIIFFLTGPVPAVNQE